MDEKHLNTGSTIAFSNVMKAATADVIQAERVVELHKWARRIGAPLVVACDTISLHFARVHDLYSAFSLFLCLFLSLRMLICCYRFHSPA
jgi:hypothetical protein